MGHMIEGGEGVDGCPNFCSKMATGFDVNMWIWCGYAHFITLGRITQFELNNICDTAVSLCLFLFCIHVSYIFAKSSTDMHKACTNMQLAEGKTQTTLGLITKKQKPKTICISITVSWGQGAHARVGNNEQMWVTEEWKDTFWSDKSWFLLQRVDGSMNPSYSASAVAACSGVMWGIFPCIDASFVWHSVPKYCCRTAVLLFGQSCLFLLFFSHYVLEEDKVSCFFCLFVFKAQIITSWFQEHAGSFKRSWDLNSVEHVHIINKK